MAVYLVNRCTYGWTRKTSGANLLDPDFAIDGSSCNSFFFSLIIAPVLSLPICWHFQGWKGCQGIARERKEERIRPNKKELHELPWDYFCVQQQIT